MADEELSINERAQIMGWVPEENFKGDPEKWVPAEQWVERAEKLLPINKATLKKLTEDIASMKQATEAERATFKEEVSTLKQTLKDFAEFSKASEERAYKKALVEVEKKQREAVENADMDMFNAAKAELDELKMHPAVSGAPVAPVAPVEPPKPDGWPKVSDPAVFQTWQNENPWYKEDDDMAAYAHQMDVILMNRGDYFPTQMDKLNKLAEIVKKKFPEKFIVKNENKDKPPSVEGGGEVGESSRKGKKTYNDLPAEARRYCDEWAGKDGKGGTIPGFTRQDYIDQFFGKD